MPVLKEFTAQTHQGPYLEINEDNCHIDVNNSLYLVLDGFGGAGVGDMVVTNLIGDISKFYTKIGNDPDSTLPFFYSPKYLIEGNALINAVQYAHKNLMKSNSGNNISQRGGASLVAAALAENMITFVSAGNCASYLYRNGHLGLITYPEVLQFYFENAQNINSHLCPSNALGMFDDLNLQVREVKVQKGDVIVMLTDGVFSKIDIDELKFVVEQKNDDTEKSTHVFNMANNKGNLDNQTFVMLRF